MVNKIVEYELVSFRINKAVREWIKEYCKQNEMDEACFYRDAVRAMIKDINKYKKA